MRKFYGGVKAVAESVGTKEYIIQDKSSLADVVAGAVSGYMDCRFPEYP
jgi:hypothetical protein